MDLVNLAVAVVFISNAIILILLVLSAILMYSLLM